MGHKVTIFFNSISIYFVTLYFAMQMIIFKPEWIFYTFTGREGKTGANRFDDEVKRGKKYIYRHFTQIKPKSCIIIVDLILIILE